VDGAEPNMPASRTSSKARLDTAARTRSARSGYATPDAPCCQRGRTTRTPTPSVSGSRSNGQKSPCEHRRVTTHPCENWMHTDRTTSPTMGTSEPSSRRDRARLRSNCPALRGGRRPGARLEQRHPAPVLRGRSRPPCFGRPQPAGARRSLTGLEPGAHARARACSTSSENRSIPASSSRAGPHGIAVTGCATA
jgi:hypothetical protein